MFRTKRLIPLMVLPALVACGTTSASNSSPANSPTPASGQVIKLTDFKVEVSPTLGAQQTTFQISNNGNQQHELLVFKTDLDPSQLPVATSGDIDEEGAGIAKVSDGDNLDPGKGQSRTVDLSKAGKYLFLCNLPGHFKLGMYATVTVQ